MARQSRMGIEQGSNTLIPTMQGVLGCLDVQLEEELIRYRRQKSKQTQAQKTGGQKDNRLAALEIIGFKPNRFRQSATTPTPVFSPSLTVSPSVTALPLPATPPVSPADFPPIAEPHAQNDRALFVASESLSPHALPLEHRGDRVALDMAAFDPIAQRSNSVQKQVYAVEDTYHLSPVAWDEQPQSSLADLSDGAMTDTRSTPSPTIAPATFTIVETYPALAPVVWTTNTPEPAATKNLVSPELVTELVSETGREPFLELPAELSEAELLALNHQALKEQSPIHPSLNAAVAPIQADPEAEQAFEAWAIDAFLEEDTPWPDHLDEDPRSDPFSEGVAPWTGSDPEDSDLESFTPELCPEASSEQAPAEEGSDVPPADSLPLALPASTLPHPSQLGVSSPFSQLGSKPGAPTGVTRLVAVGTHASQSLKPIGMGNLAGFNTPPEGYLASSEALLDHLDEEEEGSGTSIKNLNNLFTPVGLGSALLLLISALAVSVVLLNPQLVSHWELKSPWSKPAQTPPEQPVTPAVEIPGAPTIDSTDENTLSSQEFLDLDLGNLRKVNPLPDNGLIQPPNGLTPSGLGLNDPLGDPGTLSDPSADETGLLSNFRDSINEVSRESENVNAPFPLEESYGDPVEKIRQEPARESTKAPSPPKPVDRPAPSILESDPESQAPIAPSLSSSSYSVVTPYTSDQLLDQAQTIVPDAYLKNTEEGANIQFGVFNDPESAAALVDRLTEEGIPVQVVPAN